MSPRAWVGPGRTGVRCEDGTSPRPPRTGLYEHSTCRRARGGGGNELSVLSRLHGEEPYGQSWHLPAQAFPRTGSLAWAPVTRLPLPSRPMPALAEGQARMGFPTTIVTE